jgi:ATP-dependent RNA helicase DeaD
MLEVLPVQATPTAPVADSPAFSDLALSAPVLKALADVGYEAPSPIQAATIPVLLAGADVLGQAQTGTGKTAAFALPILSRIEVARSEPQALVLVPTRELAIQVAEAFQRYAAHLKGFHVLPIYGGQSYTPQLKGLKRGAHVIVGTPGRVMDHMKRGTLELGGLSFLVLDEADEMLQMGFIDDIEWILEQTPPTRQVALFSATIPNQIRRIAQKHLRSPAEITIRSKTTTAPSIRQRYWLVSGLHKLDALTRILEAETFDAMLIFVRTKLETVELAERLEARGFSVAALNGDIPQQQRERTVTGLKAGRIDIVVATDVAARGLDVERISHVVNYDVPYDSESYVHRIGRTGRAGRSGEAILFIAPRERNMLRIIERATRQKIEQMNLPSIADVNEQRVARFKQRIADALTGGDAEAFRPLIEQFEREQNVPAIEIAAALASLLQGTAPLLLPEKPERRDEGWIPTPRKHDAGDGPAAASRESAEPRARRQARESDIPLETYRIEVGHVHKVKPGNIVGAIANEAGLDGRHIGHVDIREDHSFVDLPEGMPKEIFQSLKKARVGGRELRISRVAGKPPKHPRKSVRHHDDRGRAG